MLNIPFLKRTFVRQSGADDCGLACLAMILNYTGQPEAVAYLRELPVHPGGLSLLELRELAATFNLNSRCVEMEPSFLRSMRTPCILLTCAEDGLPHFEVCYGALKHRKTIEFLLADPAQQVYRLEESELLKRWPSRAALYFPDLRHDSTAFPDSAFRQLLKLLPVPAGVWVVVPLFSVAVASFGVALSWVLQRGLSDTEILQGHVMGALIPLLFMISFFKSGFSYVRQYILIRVNAALHEHLVHGHLAKLFHFSAVRDLHLSAQLVRNITGDIHRIQQAASALIGTVLSDGFLALMTLGAMAYFAIWPAILNLVLSGLMLVYMYYRLPALTLTNIKAHHLHQAAESEVIRDIGRLLAIKEAGLLEQRKSAHQLRRHRMVSQVRLTAVRLTTFLFVGECAGAVIVIFTLMIGYYQYMDQQYDYTTFMLMVIAAYLLSNLTLRIGNAMLTVAEGADAAIQYRLHSVQPSNSFMQEYQFPS